MITVGFDLDGTICLLPFGCEQIMLTRHNEKIFWYFQRFKSLQRLYNFFFRRANSEIKELMGQLREQGFEVVIISASHENNRQELERWLKEKGFYFDKLYLKSTPENCLDYKKRLVPRFCHYYWDDKKEIIDYLRGNNGKCQVLLYQKQKREELLNFLSILNSKTA